MTLGLKTVRAVGCLIVASCCVAPVHGAGFGIFEQGSKAMGMAGAFVAQADDPSAMFHNVGGLAFLKEREFQAGGTIISSSGAEFEGAAPFPGPGTTEGMASLLEVPPHFYWVEPLNERWTFGLAVNSPFGLTTEWDEPDFTGRFVSREASVVTVDINPNLGWKLSDRVGIGFGPIIRTAGIELIRNQAAINPFTATATDIAVIDLESDFETGVGFQFGFNQRVNNSFSWGFAYRGAIEIDFGGDGNLTQVLSGSPQFDALVAASLPFNQTLSIETTIEFPEMAMFGVAVALSPNWLVEVDANFTGWSSLDEVVIDFGGQLPVTTLRQDWDDVNNYRLGFRWDSGPRTQWRFGYVFDETPQPLTTFGPLLPDGDRNGVTVGYGFIGQNKILDFALMYLPIEERTTLVNESGFNGTYDTQALLLGATVGW